MGGEVPVWVSGVEKWVTGITKQTTCEEIVKALLRSSSAATRTHVTDYHQYVIVESWRRVERPLDRHSRILKVWRTWGEEQSHVRLTLRRLTHPLLSSDRSKPATSYRKHKHDDNATISKPGGAVFQMWRPANWHKHKTMHPKKLAKYKDPHVSNAKCSVQNPKKPTRTPEVHGDKKDMDDAQDRSITSTMERLIRMVLVQGETIQVQLQRMRDKDDQIKYFEQKIHELRLEELGENYLIDSYLKSEIGPIKSDLQEKSAELLNSEEIAQCVSYYKRTMAAVKKLEAQERAISWLSVQLAHELSDPNRDVTDCSELQMLTNALEGHMAMTSANHIELTENEAELAEMDCHLPAMRKTVVRLQRELHAADSEALRLNSVWRELCNQMEDKGCASTLEDDVLVLCCKGKNPADNDSNSDTGLSSLHSSADEDIFIFDTLV